MNDMTIADVEAAATANAERYEPRFKGCAQQAFQEGAIWAHTHLLKSHHPPFFTQELKEKEEMK